MTSPAHLFEEAKQDFAAAHFDSAIRHAREADLLVKEQIQISRKEHPIAPHYSIVIVTYKDTADVRKSWSRLSHYSDDQNYEIIVVNNGNSSANRLAAKLFSHYTFIEVGFNYGCSGARNIGAYNARGEFIIFVDDDGFVDEGSLENLIKVITEHNAIMVRGRVLTKSPSAISARHYNLGDDIITSGPNAECLLICRRAEYLKFGGFDTLLAGHEGWALCSKMYPVYGPNSFLYSPHAIIRHDYASDNVDADKKAAKFRSNRKYLAEHYPFALDLMASFETPGVARARKIVELEARVSELKLELSSKKRELSSKKRELSAKKRQLKIISEKANSLDAAYQDVMRSSSWRITAPLRKIAKALRSIAPRSVASPSSSASKDKLS